MSTTTTNRTTKAIKAKQQESNKKPKSILPEQKLGVKQQEMTAIMVLRDLERTAKLSKKSINKRNRSTEDNDKEDSHWIESGKNVIGQRFPAKRPRNTMELGVGGSGGGDDYAKKNEHHHVQQEQHLRNMMEQELNNALQFATEGNTILMNISLCDAKKHALSCSSSSPSSSSKTTIVNETTKTNNNNNMLKRFEVRESYIRSQLSTKNETNFHLRRMEDELKYALKFAREGNRSLMDLSLHDAKTHAVKANNQKKNENNNNNNKNNNKNNNNKSLSMFFFENRAAYIRSQLTDEIGFHQRKMQDDLKYALQFAKEGNKPLMDIFLCDAKKHATFCYGEEHGSYSSPGSKNEWILLNGKILEIQRVFFMEEGNGGSSLGDGVNKINQQQQQQQTTSPHHQHANGESTTQQGFQQYVS